MLIRLDLNVPFEKEVVSDLSRVKRVVPTLKLIIKNGGRPVILSHLGRPKSNEDTDLSLKKLLPYLKKELKTEIAFCEYDDFDTMKQFVNEVPVNRVILLENTRFWPGEVHNELSLSTFFSELGDIFCNDAFSVSHRAHASTVGVANLLPSCSGLLLEEELATLEKVLLDPLRPIVAVIGGAKVSTKLALLENLIKKVDHIVVGGGMANTFLFAQGFEIGKSLMELEQAKTARYILNSATKENCNIHLPLDLICAKQLKKDAQYTTHPVDECPKEKMILDAGPKTIVHVESVFADCKTLVWNGPLGAFEITPFDHATNTLAKTAAKLTSRGSLISVAGGGDTVSALNSKNLAKKFSYVSTAGGAFLEWMEGKKLPGIQALESR